MHRGLLSSRITFNAASMCVLVIVVFKIDSGNKMHGNMDGVISYITDDERGGKIGNTKDKVAIELVKFTAGW